MYLHVLYMDIFLSMTTCMLIGWYVQHTVSDVIGNVVNEPAARGAHTNDVSVA